MHDSDYGLYITTSNTTTMKNIQSYDNFHEEIYGNSNWLLSGNNDMSYYNEYGEISFIDSFNSDIEADVTGDLTFGTGQNIVIADNSITVSLSDLNNSANLTLYNVGDRGYVQPQIQKDGVACSDCVAFTSLTATNVKFNVTGFSTYSIGDGDPVTIPQTAIDNTIEALEKFTAKWSVMIGLFIAFVILQILFVMMNNGGISIEEVLSILLINAGVFIVVGLVIAFGIEILNDIREGL